MIVATPSPWPRLPSIFINTPSRSASPKASSISSRATPLLHLTHVNNPQYRLFPQYRQRRQQESNHLLYPLYPHARLNGHARMRGGLSRHSQGWASHGGQSGAGFNFRRILEVMFGPFPDPGSQSSSFSSCGFLNLSNSRSLLSAVLSTDFD